MQGLGFEPEPPQKKMHIHYAYDDLEYAINHRVKCLERSLEGIIRVGYQ